MMKGDYQYQYCITADTFHFQSSLSTFQLTIILLLLIAVGYIGLVIFFRGKNELNGTIGTHTSTSRCCPISEADADDKNVSSRCIFSTQTVSLPYKKSMSKALADPCHPVDNRNGYIVLCRAENKLVTKELSKRLSRESVAKIAFGDESTYRYDDVRGLYFVREVIARFIMKYFISDCAYSSDSDVDNRATSQLMIQPEHIVIGSGATSILNYLYYFLAEEKDVVLIPAPYYAAFDGDTKVRTIF